MKYLLLIGVCTLFTLSACRKELVLPPVTTLRIDLQHKVGSVHLAFDSLMYENKAGESYSVTKLNYYLSGICFYKNRQLVFTVDTIAYIDARTGRYSFRIADIPAFTYDSVSYFIGVPLPYNEHGKLTSTYENVAMEWPDMMGGGYHFLKLEGHWKDTGSISGYAIHLGTNACLVKGGHKISGHTRQGVENVIGLSMDINEWLEAPHTYSFKSDGVYTMGDAILMQRISENGRDVIKVLQ